MNRRETDTKPSNPKDAFGSAKAPLGLVPDTGNADVAMAFLEGALKYGRYNWRVAGVRASIYNDAVERHRAKWWNGQNRDPLTRVKHLANLRACVDILLDAELCGMLEDDRPPALPYDQHVDSLQPHIQHLKALFASHSPPQYTQKSHPRSQTSIPPGLTYADVYGPPVPVAPINCTVQPGGCSGCQEENARRSAYVGTGVKPPECPHDYPSDTCCVPAGTIVETAADVRKRRKVRRTGKI